MLFDTSIQYTYDASLKYQVLHAYCALYNSFSTVSSLPLSHLHKLFLSAGERIAERGGDKGDN